MKELDLNAEIAPQLAMEQLEAISPEGLSDKAKNWLNYFYAKILLSMQQYDKVESLIIDCLAKAIPERDFGILVYGNILLSFHCRSQISFSQEKASLEIALDYAIQSGDLELLLSARSYHQAFLRSHSHFEAALKENKLIEGLLKQVKKSHLTINALMKASSLQMDMKKTDKAIKYLHEALLQAQALHIPYLQLVIINNLSTAYCNIGNRQGRDIAEPRFTCGRRDRLPKAGCDVPFQFGKHEAEQ